MNKFYFIFFSIGESDPDTNNENDILFYLFYYIKY